MFSLVVDNSCLMSLCEVPRSRISPYRGFLLPYMVKFTLYKEIYGTVFSIFHAVCYDQDSSVDYGESQNLLLFQEAARS